MSFTTDLDRIRRVSLAGQAVGHDVAVMTRLPRPRKSVAERQNRHRALLVITDGVDTGSRMNAPEVSGIASSIDVPVYLLTVVNPARSSRRRASGASKPTGEHRRDRDACRSRALDRRRHADLQRAGAHASRRLHDLFGELRYQYLITFEPGLALGGTRSRFAYPEEEPCRSRARRVHLGPARSSTERPLMRRRSTHA